VSLNDPGGIKGAFVTPGVLSALATTLESGMPAAAIEAVCRNLRLVRFIVIYFSSFVKKSINVQYPLELMVSVPPAYFFEHVAKGIAANA
jgi:hypothetical protein